MVDAAVVEAPKADAAPAVVAAPTPAADPKPADVKPAVVADTPPAAVELKLALPPDAVIDQARLDDIAAFAKSEGLSQAAAEKLLARENAHEAKRAKEIADGQAKWEAEALAAADLGAGDPKKLGVSVELAKKGLSLVDPDGEVAAFLESTKFGSSPVALRLFQRIARMNAEDGVASAKPAVVKPKSLADHYA